MLDRHLLTDSELAEIQRRRPGAIASLACEGMFLTAEEQALVAQMDDELLPRAARTARIIEFIRAKQNARQRVNV